MSAAHVFADSLAASHRASDWPGWEPLYRAFFPTFKTMVDHREDGEHQRAGIDRSVVLRNSKQILVDEKVRGRSKRTGRVYEDILLETVSVRRGGSPDVPGWVVKELRADFIAYLIEPIGKVYLLPVLQLQIAWSRCGAAWTQRFGEREAQNGRYVTMNVPVPVADLFGAMGAGLRSTFEPWEPTE